MKPKKYFLSAVVLSALFMAPIYFVFASSSAAINLSPASGSYKVGQTFSVGIYIVPGTDKIDTVRAKLTFPPDILEIKNFSTNSIFGYQAGSNGFDNTAGTFSWGAGTTGGITSASNFGTITFFVKKSGIAKISLTNDSLALSDGVNEFDGQLSSSNFTLTLAPKPIAQKKPVQKTSTQQLAAVKPVEANSVVDTQIVTQNQPQNFAASLLGSISFIRALDVAGIILVLVLLVFTFYKIIEKNPKKVSLNNKK